MIQTYYSQGVCTVCVIIEQNLFYIVLYIIQFHCRKSNPHPKWRWHTGRVKLTQNPQEFGAAKYKSERPADNPFDIKARLHSTFFFFWLRMRWCLSQQMACTELNGCVRTVTVKTSSAPLQPIKRRKKSHLQIAQCEQAHQAKLVQTLTRNMITRVLLKNQTVF